MDEEKERAAEKGDQSKIIFGMVKMGEKGQIVIPKEARDMFGLKPGDMILVLGDVNYGLAIPKKDIIDSFREVLANASGFPMMQGDDNGNKKEKNK